MISISNFQEDKIKKISDNFFMAVVVLTLSMEKIYIIG